jgi:hypothetical protein
MALATALFEQRTAMVKRTASRPRAAMVALDQKPESKRRTI